MTKHDEDQAILLFSYGTLQQDNVQLATFGRRLEGRPDVLAGYAVTPVLITDPQVIATSGKDVHTIAGWTGDPGNRIAGMVFEISAEELEAADRYEVGDYTRVEVRLESGYEVFLYVAGGTDGPE